MPLFPQVTSPMSRVAFLTMDSLDGFVSYDSLVRDILLHRGIVVDEVSWRVTRGNWDQYKLVLIRSPWDYQQSCDEFLNVLSQIDASNARLENSLDIVRWNVRKTYLQQLEQSGVTIVPTHWVSSPSVAELRNLFADLNYSAVVIKPVVGAGAENAFWLRPESPESLFQQVQQVYAGKIGLAQPFVESVTTFGELSLIFFGDDFSHCVQKQPKSGDFRVQEEHGGLIQSYEPSPELLSFARKALQKVPGKTVYARVDIVMLNDASPAIMEVELIEPSLYLSYDLKSPERFANVIEALL